LTAPRIIIGAVYQKLNEDMNFLWTKELRINTVHVKYSFFYLFCRKRGFSSVQMIRDVAAALVLLAQKGKSGEVYNLADKNDTGTARSLSISLLTSQKKTKKQKTKNRPGVDRLYPPRDLRHQDRVPGHHHLQLCQA